MNNSCFTLLAVTFVVFLSQISSAQAEGNSILKIANALVQDAESSISYAEIYARKGDFGANNRERDRHLCTALGALEAKSTSITEVLMADEVITPAFEKSLEVFTKASRANLYCSALNSYNGNRSEMQKSLKLTKSSLKSLKALLK